MLLPGPPAGGRLALIGLLWDAGKAVLACMYEAARDGENEEDEEEEGEEDEEKEKGIHSSLLLRVWDLPTGTLERSLRGAAAAAMMRTMRTVGLYKLNESSIPIACKRLVTTLQTIK
jgi:hypothetical protein